MSSYIYSDKARGGKTRDEDSARFDPGFGDTEWSASAFLVKTVKITNLVLTDEQSIASAIEAGRYDGKKW
jgi:hypothetical protein